MNKIVRAERLKWTGTIPWEVLAHATFPYPVEPEICDIKMNEFLDRLERRVHGRVACVYGMEKFTKRLSPIRPHYHFVMKGIKPLAPRVVKDEWLKTVTGSTKSNDDIIHADPYNPSRPGLDYVLKLADGYHGEWNFHNLGWFLPDRKALFEGSDSRRAERRFQERLRAA